MTDRNRFRAGDPRAGRKLVAELVAGLVLVIMVATVAAAGVITVLWG